MFAIYLAWCCPMSQQGTFERASSSAMELSIIISPARHRSALLGKGICFVQVGPDSIHVFSAHCSYWVGLIVFKYAEKSCSTSATDILSNV
jgi:hypothetical protein